MTSVPAPSFTPEAAVTVILILLVPFAVAGIALINAGLGRSRSAAHTMLASLCIFRGRGERVCRSVVLPGKATSALPPV